MLSPSVSSTAWREASGRQTGGQAGRARQTLLRDDERESVPRGHREDAKHGISKPGRSLGTVVSTCLRPERMAGRVSTRCQGRGSNRWGRQVQTLEPQRQQRWEWQSVEVRLPKPCWLHCWRRPPPRVGIAHAPRTHRLHCETARRHAVHAGPGKPPRQAVEPAWSGHCRPGPPAWAPKKPTRTGRQAGARSAASEGRTIVAAWEDAPLEPVE